MIGQAVRGPTSSVHPLVVLPPMGLPSPHEADRKQSLGL